MAILGLDIGTTGCKSTILDERGACIAKSYREYHAVRNNEKQILDGKEVWESVKFVISESVKKAGQPVRAIGVSSFGESFVPVDNDGNPLYEIMLYTDDRGIKECAKLSQLLSPQTILSLTGVAPHPMYSISKMMWFKEKCPQEYKKTKKFLLMEDYIIFKLTGEAYIDYSLASRTMAFDIRKKCWSDEVLSAAGIEKEKLSVPVISGTAVAKVKGELISELSLGIDTWVVTGGHDQVCSAVGVGALSAGVSVDGTGTVECITPVFDSPITNDVMRDCGYACVPHAIDGLYVTYAFSFTGGAMLKWYRDTFAKYEAELANQNGENIYALLDSAISDSPSGLLVLPHFAGAATPYMDNSAVGTITGLSLATESIDIYRGIMEGVTYEMLVNLDCLEKAGIKIDEMRATGGGAYSAPWLQMKADITGRKIISYENCEAGTVGSIALAATALGDFKKLSDAANAFSVSGKIYLPNDKHKERYMELYRKYKKLYGATKEIMNIK